MSARLDATRMKVQGILTDEFKGVHLDGDGDLSIRHQSARVFVGVSEWGEDSTIVRVWAPFLVGFEVTPEVYEFVAKKSGEYLFGHPVLREGSDGALLSFRHNLLGDYLDAAELNHAVVAVALTANDLDDEAQAKFGGRRFHEDG